LIDLHQESRHGRSGGALDFIETPTSTEVLGVSVHVVGELRMGAELSKQPLREHEELDQLLSGLVVVHPDSRFAPAFGRLAAAIH
jgi:predicted nucleic acid-binding protein